MAKIFFANIGVILTKCKHANVGAIFLENIAIFTKIQLIYNEYSRRYSQYKQGWPKLIY